MGQERRSLKEEAKHLFNKFYEKSKDIQEATASTIKDLSQRIPPTKEKVKEITEGISEGIEEVRKQAEERIEVLKKSLQEITSKASLTINEAVQSFLEGAEASRGRECLSIFTERRSITYFDPNREVPEEVIKEILNISALTPSGYNIQPWEVVVVKSKDKKKKLREICYDQEKVEHASANVVIIANTNAGEEHVDRVLDSWVELGYIKAEEKAPLKEKILSKWQSLEKKKRKAIRDSAMFAMSLMIVARHFGLETHPMEGYDETKLRRFLKLEKGKIPVMIVAMGYKDPDKELLPRAYRFSFEEFGRFM